MMHYTFFLFGFCSSLANAECTCPFGTPAKTTNQGCEVTPEVPECCSLRDSQRGSVVCASCEPDFILFRNNSICYAKTCTCPNGTPSDLVAATPSQGRCPRVDGKSCKDCDEGYKINLFQTACFPLTCTCANGTPADPDSRGSCPVEDGKKCKSCAEGYTLNTEQTACLPNTCNCANGTPTPPESGVCPAEDGKSCETCDSGYVLNTEKTACIKKQCVCDNGTAASGTQCPTQGDQKCVKCKAGFVLYTDSEKCLVPNGSHCSANDQCKSGTCLESTNGSFKCVCNDNCIYKGPIVQNIDNVSTEAACKKRCSTTVAAAYSFNIDTKNCQCLETSALPQLNRFYVSGLITKDCICENGDAPANPTEQCPVEHPINCTGCKEGYFLKNLQCFLNICKCKNGTPAEGKVCPKLDAQQCTKCNDGYYKSTDGTSCLKNLCECKNGTPAEGRKCPTNGDKLCASCNPGFTLNSDKTKCVQKSNEEQILV